MDRADQQMNEKSQGSHTHLDSPAPSRPDGLGDGPSDDLCKCGAPRSMKNLERCMRGHPMPGAVIHPRKHGSRNLTRVEQLAAEFIEDWKPQTHRMREEVRRLADLWEQRERVERSAPGSVEHQRLDTIIQALVERLESSRPDAGANMARRTVVILPEKVMHDEVAVAKAIEAASAQPAVAGPSRDSTVGLAAAAAGEPEPVLYAGRLRITEEHVRECMADRGDEMLAAYLAGRISKASAYEMTRRTWLQMQELSR
jgi:hypothetical protein